MKVSSIAMAGLSAVIILLLLAMIMLVMTGEQVTSAVAPEHAAMAKELQSLTEGDFILTTSDENYVVRRVAINDRFRLANLFTGEFSSDIYLLAPRVKRFVRMTDPAWPETAKRFLIK